MMNPPDAAAALRDAGMRMTPQRRALIEALSGDRSHPSAEEIARRVSARMPGVSLSTVYKTLHEFAQAGLLREIAAPGSMRFDPEVSPHAHLVCPRCGCVSDVTIAPSVLDALARAAGVTNVGVTLHGSCRSCTPN